MSITYFSGVAPADALLGMNPGPPKHNSLAALRKEIRRIERGGGASDPPTSDAPESDTDSVRREIKKRLRRQADKAAAQYGGPQSKRAAVRYARDLPDVALARGPRWTNDADPVSIAEAAPGRVVESIEGPVWVVEERLGGSGAQWAWASERLARGFDGPGAPAARYLEGLFDLCPEATLGDLAFFDLETTGLGSSPLFLIGAMVYEDGELVVRQYLARDYSEEPATLALFHDLLDGRRIYVSFNGKSFDAPFLRARAAALGLALREPPCHLDLLYASRRRWKGELPNCKLQTLEHFICGRQRQGDVPSAMIPEVYHDFVRTGDASVMQGVMLHNKLDLITLAELLAELAEGAQGS